MSLQSTDDRTGTTRDTNNSAIADLAMKPVGGQSACETETCPMTEFNTLQVRAENRVMRDALMDRAADKCTTLNISDTMFSSNTLHATKLTDMFAPLNGSGTAIAVNTAAPTTVKREKQPKAQERVQKTPKVQERELTDKLAKKTKVQKQTKQPATSSNNQASAKVASQKARQRARQYMQRNKSAKR